MSSKNIVKAFYDLDLSKKTDVLSYFHNDCEILWNSSKGQSIHGINEIKILLEELYKNYHSYTSRVTHLLEDNGVVTARYTVYVTSIETPDKEDALAHFITIWELKDNKLYRGYQISQLAENDNINMISF
jgi:hypothetical protein